MTSLLISALIGYVLGSFQPAYIFGKIFGGMDIREKGSGNAGTSNITTIMGLKFGIAVGFLDVLKGMLAVLITKALFPDDPSLAFFAGLMAVTGHIFPFYMGFKGGKGVAALVGMMMGLNVWLGILFILLVVVPGLVFDYIVIGSFTTFIALPIVAYLRDMPIWIMAICLVYAVLIFYLHRGNIQRIRAGEETKVSAVLFKKKDAKEEDPS